LFDGIGHFDRRSHRSLSDSVRAVPGDQIELKNTTEKSNLKIDPITYQPGTVPTSDRWTIRAWSFYSAKAGRHRISPSSLDFVFPEGFAVLAISQADRDAVLKATYLELLYIRRDRCYQVADPKGTDSRLFHPFGSLRGQNMDDALCQINDTSFIAHTASLARYAPNSSVHVQVSAAMSYRANTHKGFSTRKALRRPWSWCRW
jgi:hypothetical protein